MRSRFVRLLVLLLVPVLFITGPAAPGAQAATTYGPRADWEAEWHRQPTDMGRISCDAVAQWAFDGFMQSVRTSMKCDVGSLAENDWDVRIRYYGTPVNTSGVPQPGTCAFGGSRTDETDLASSQVYTSVQGWDADSIIDVPLAIVSKCNVDRVCYSFIDDNWGDDKEHQGCETVTVGFPPGAAAEVVPEGCTWGKPAAKPVAVGAPRLIWDGSRNVYSQQYRVLIDSTNATAREWEAYAVMNSPGSATEPAGTLITNPAHSLVVPIRVANMGTRVVNANVQQELLFEVNVSRRWFNSADTPIPTGAAVQVQGFGFFATLYPSTASNNVGVIQGQRTTPQRPPDVGNSGIGRWGVTDASKCAYYWGPKIADKPAAGDTTDEPIGVIGTPAPVQPGDPAPVDPEQPGTDPGDGCGFSITDPSSWASGGICALVGLTMGLIDVLGDILAAIGRLIPMFGELLKTLFVPSPSSWGMGGLVDQVKARPPFSVAKGVTDAGTNFAGGFTSSSCQELLDFETIAPGIGTTSVECNDVRSKPGYSAGYTIATWGLYLLTGLGVYRMIASNLGDKS